MTAFDATDLFNLGWIAARQESTYGTRNGAGTTRWVGIAQSAVMRRVPKLIPLGGIRDSRIGAGAGHLEVRTMEEVELIGQIQNAWPFYAALGKISTTGVNPYTHAITILRSATGGTDTYLPAFTMEALYQKTTPTQVSVLGSVAKTLTCNFPIDDIAKFTLNMAGQAEGSASTAPTENILAPYGAYNTDIQIDSVNGTFTSGASVKGLNSVDMTIDNNLKIEGEFNTKLIRRSYQGNLRDGISGTINRKYLDSDLIALADGTPFSMQVQMTRGANDYIYLTLQNCIADPLERTMNYENQVENTPLRFFANSIQVDAKDANSAYT